jgi:GTPase
MVVVNNKTPQAIKTFDAEIIVYRTHSTTIRVRYEPVLHVHSLRTTTQLIEILTKEHVELKRSADGNSSSLSSSSSENNSDCASDSANLTVLSLGDRATVRLRFKYKPQCVSVGDKILLTEGSVRMTGVITNLVEFTT